MEHSSVFESDRFRQMLEEAGALKEPPEEDGSLRQAWFIRRAQGLVREASKELGRDLTACVVTFGCQMNERDSEKLRGILSLAGFELTQSENADFVLYNTCTVRENANVRVYGRLGSLIPYTRKNPGMIIALCGCMMQEKEEVDRIREKYPFVSLVFGTHNLFRFAQLLTAALIERSAYLKALADAGQGDGRKGKVTRRRVIEVSPKEEAIVENLPVERTYPFKSGLNIMFGCNNFCTYCIVPYVRGRERSRRSEDILMEAQQLADDGVKEIMLLGQNVNSYGKGLEESVTFAQLLKKMEQVDGIERIRFMTSHPKDLSDELIETMAGSEKVCRHLHLPLQSGSSRLLKAMNRHYTKESYLALVEKLRAAMPDLSLTTDLIVGFPGETEEDLQETIDVVRRAQFDSAFTFLYSPRAGTPAASMEDQIPEDVAKERFDRLLAEVQRVGRERSSRFEGSVMDVLVEERNKQDPGLVTGRIGQNLVVHFPGDASLIGSVVPVRLTEAKGFYYFGEEVRNADQ